MDKQIFKVGDRVFDIRFGWGEVCHDYNDGDLTVRFTNKDNTFTMLYRPDGKSSSFQEIPLLSFTEYTLQGFSQERLIDYNIYIGKWGKFWNNGYKQYLISKLEKIVLGSFRPNTEKKFYDNFEPLTEEQIKILGL